MQQKMQQKDDNFETRIIAEHNYDYTILWNIYHTHGLIILSGRLDNRIIQ